MIWAPLFLLLLTGCAASTTVDYKPRVVTTSSFDQPLSVQAPPTSVTVVTAQDLQWEETDPRVVAFNLYYGFLFPHEYDNVITGITNLDCVISNLVPGITYYMAATGLDTNGVESDFSTEYVFVMPMTLEFGFSFDQSVTNVTVQSSTDLMTWQESLARQRTNGLWRVDVDGELAQEFYRGTGQAVPAL